MIKSISIKNYKGIKELDNLIFGPGVTFVIGQNGAGKSTLISSIYLTQQLVQKRSANDVFSKVAPFGRDLLSHNQQDENVHFAFCIRGRDGTYRFSYSVKASDGDFIISGEKLEEVDSKYEPTKICYERTPNGIKIPDQDGTFLTVPLHTDSDELVLSGYNEARAKDAADTIKSYRVLWLNGGSDAEFRMYNKNASDLTNLDAMAVRLYNSDKKSFNSAVKVIQSLIPSFIAPEIREIRGNSEDDVRYVVFWHENWPDSTTLEYTLPNLSDGNIRIVQLVFSIFSSSDFTCIIGEEIENGQHFGRLKTLVEIIKTLSAKRNIQMIFTTHSSELLSYIAPSDVIYVSRTEDGFSNFETLGKKIDARQAEEILGEELGYSLDIIEELSSPVKGPIYAKQWPKKPISTSSPQKTRASKGSKTS